MVLDYTLKIQMAGGVGWLLLSSGAGLPPGPLSRQPPNTSLCWLTCQPCLPFQRALSLALVGPSYMLGKPEKILT